MTEKHLQTELEPSDRLILLVSKLKVSESDIAGMDMCLTHITDWNAFTVQVIKRGVAGLLNQKLSLLQNKKCIPDDMLVLIEQAYFRTVNRSVLLYSHFSTVTAALQSHGIEVVALKGVYLSEHLYGEIGLRQFSDIDLLIRPDRTLEAVEILESLGYRYKESVPVSNFIRQKSDFVHLPPMILNGVSVELHIKLNRGSEKFNINIDRVFATKISVRINGNDVFALDEMHQLIHVALHAHKHFEEGNVNFTSFIDLANMLNALPGGFYWKSFAKLCDVYNSSEIVFRYLLLVNDYFCLNAVPEEFLHKYKGALSSRHKHKFVLYLQGYKYTEPAKTAIPGHINNLWLLKNPRERAKYMFDLFFPPKSFMIDKYKIRNEKLYLLYYPYRYLTIFTGLWHIVSKKMKTRT